MFMTVYFALSFSYLCNKRLQQPFNCQGPYLQAFGVPFEVHVGCSDSSHFCHKKTATLIPFLLMNLKNKLKCSLLNKKHPFSVSKGHSISRNIRFDSNGASLTKCYDNIQILPAHFGQKMKPKANKPTHKATAVSHCFIRAMTKQEPGLTQAKHPPPSPLGSTKVKE